MHNKTISDCTERYVCVISSGGDELSRTTLNYTTGAKSLFPSFLGLHNEIYWKSLHYNSVFSFQ
jgi:hypothetical protein